MTRIVGGAAGGRRLAVPPGRGTRPTSERAREGLFSTLDALCDGLEGTRVADLYAGSGAVGLEALSRGAAHVLLVESDPKALAVCRANAAALGVPGAEVRAGRVERVVDEGPGGAAYDVVFLDPPYDVADAAVTTLLAALRDGRWLAPGAVVVVERATRGPALGWPDGYVGDRSRRYGEGTLWYGRARP